MIDLGASRSSPAGWPSACPPTRRTPSCGSGRRTIAWNSAPAVAQPPALRPGLGAGGAAAGRVQPLPGVRRQRGDPARDGADRRRPVPVRLGHRRRGAHHLVAAAPLPARGALVGRARPAGCTSRTSWWRWPPPRCSGCATGGAGRRTCAAGASSAPPAWSPTSSTRPPRRGGRRRTACSPRSPGSPPGAGRRSACTAPATLLNAGQIASNPVAAMPSLHTAFALFVVLFFLAGDPAPLVAAAAGVPAGDDVHPGLLAASTT